MAYDPGRPETMFYQADRMIEEGNIAEATKILQELIDNHPDFGRAYNHLGYIFETKYRDYRKAEMYYKKCLEMSPEYPAIYLNYSILLSQQQRFDELEVLLYQALDCPGINKAKVHNEFGMMYEMKGQYDRAIEEYKKAIRFSFEDKHIGNYKKSIERAAEKKNFLGGNGNRMRG